MPWVRRKRFAAVSVLVGALALSGPVALASTPTPSVSDVDVLTLGQTATITVHGKVHDLGRLGSVMDPVAATPSGDLVVADNMLKLISPSGKVTVLSGKATVDGFAVSPGGRYVVWSIEPHSTYRVKGLYKLLMYDLASRRLVHSRTVSDQVVPVGFLDDGRVAIAGEGGPLPSYLWTPSTGALAKLGASRLPSVTHAAGHLVVLSDESSGCAAMVKDSRTGRGVRLPADTGCEFIQGLSPDGTRWWSVVLSAVDDRLVAAPGIAAAVSGRPDPRLSRLFFHQRMSMTDAAWLDRKHLLVVAQRYRPGTKVGRQLEELCTIPVRADPTCSTVKDLGPYERPDEGTNDPSIGYDVWLARPLGQ